MRLVDSIEGICKNDYFYLYIDYISKKNMIMKKYLFILLGVLFFSNSINSQEKKITIKVKDVNNKAVAGAIILFDSEKQNILTNSNGVFKTKLKFDPKEISAFHPNIGIKKIKYNGENNLIIKIKEGNDLHIAVKSPKLNKNVDSGQFNTIYDYLRGKVRGVHIGSNNTIRIRGYNTVNGNMTPLFVINGNYVSQETFGTTVPTDIKSVTVLSGPETAIYGMRGANGVIVVKTK